MSADLVPWIVFVVAVVALLALDLGVLGRRQAVMSTRRALAWSAVWIGLGLSFSLAVWGWRGATAAQEYLAGYLIEESLSIDNLFVFLVVFGHSASPCGISGRCSSGASSARSSCAASSSSLAWACSSGSAGSCTCSALSWSSRPCACCARTASRSTPRSPLVRVMRRLFPVAMDDDSGSFSVRREGRRMLTPLAIALVAIESADLVFAVDSVPAVLAVSDDAFVVFTSNVAPILGLRALYFALAGSLERFEYLSWGLAAVLGFVGAKMLLADVVHVPIYMSLTVIVIAVGGAILASLAHPRAGGGHGGAPGGGARRPAGAAGGVTWRARP